MPLILALIGALVRAVGPLVAQVLLSLGITFVSIAGIDIALTEAKARAFDSLSAGGQLFVSLVGILQIGTALNIIFSAMVARTLLMGLAGGKLTKMITKS